MYDPATGDLWVWDEDGAPTFQGCYDNSHAAERQCANMGWSFLDAGTIPKPTPEQIKCFSDKLRAVRGI
jgi:hypothetical protein